MLISEGQSTVLEAIFELEFLDCASCSSSGIILRTAGAETGWGCSRLDDVCLGIVITKGNKCGVKFSLFCCRS